jgi:two-component system CheB/CheR fusion protein
MKANNDKPKIKKQLTKKKQLIKSPNIFPVVGIGASAGGLDAFKKLLKAIPENSGMAYVLVQHLDPSHESMLQELLQKVTNIPVLEIRDDIKVEPNHIYIIPSNKMMISNDGVLELSPRPAKSKNERNLPIDLFFTSLAEVHQSHAIGVVLSGTASDGTMGLKAIKEHGGVTFAQDEESAAYDGMPHSAVEAGVVDFILPPEKIPQKLLEVVHIINGNGEQNLNQQAEDVFKQIISLLRIRKGTDFTYYKQTTIRRRILRRMAIIKTEEPIAYLKYLRENKPEQDILYLDLLIPVTDFFRDTKIFDNLCSTVFPQIVKNKSPGELIRVWVAGCSTGEEVYSIAICFHELLSDRFSENSFQKIQIFATDISEPAIAKARAGYYTKTDVKSLTPIQLQEYFTKSNGGYQANKSIRNMCVFAIHNFLKDPPFGKMDFISCRNVLIYMEPYLQKKALTTFHYALNQNGFLLLGKSETTGGVPELFATANKTDKLFTSKNVPSHFINSVSRSSEQNFSIKNIDMKSESIKTDFQKTADDIMLRKYTPAGVVVNEAMDIVHFRGNTTNYLQQASGKPSHNLLKMAKDGLAFELRNIIHKAKKDKASVIKDNIPLQLNDQLLYISIEAMPLPDTIEPHYLVLFHENGSRQSSGVSSEMPAKKGSKLKIHDSQLTLRIQQLEKELAQSREDMRSITEDQEAANEELQSANEELLSGSEELQSLNEEMETSKEELQSTNEELTVVNQEIISLNEQVTAAKNYAEAIVAAVHEPLLVLDKKLQVRSANNAFYKTFQVNEKDTEGKLIYHLGNKQWDIPELRSLLDDILLRKTVFQDFEVKQNFPNIGDRIMRLNAREMSRDKEDERLILLAIEDITERKKAEEILNKSGEHFRNLVKELPSAVYSCDAKGYITFYNEAAIKLWGRKPVIGKERWCGSLKIYDREGIPMELDSCPMAKTIKESRTIKSEEIIIERPDGSRSTVLVNPQPEYDINGNITGAINMLFDITENVTARKKLEESEIRSRLIADLMPEKVSNADPDGNPFYYNKQWTDYTGMSMDELIKKGWTDLVHPDEYPEMLSSWQHSLETGEDHEIEFRCKNKHGDYIWHISRATAVKSADGKISVWIGTTTEIESFKKQHEVLETAVSEKTKELEEANADLKKKNQEIEETRAKLMSDYSRSLIEASLDPLVTISAAGKITDVNEASTKITGMGREELIGTSFSNYFTEPEKAQKGYQQAFEKGFVADYPLTIKHKNGELKDVLYNASVYKNEKGDVLGIFAAARDVTDQKRISKELTEAIVFAELATGIAEDAKVKAEKATEIAEDAVKAKQQFLSNMSHEIRTPMNAIIGFTKVVLKTDITAKQKEYLTAIRLSGNSLIVLINDILDLAKVDAGKMTFEEIPFKLSSSISAMTHLFETKVQEKNIKLVTEYDNLIPEVLLGDPVRLHQIILNLVSNAVKFTSKGKITVAVHLLKDDEDNAIIEFTVSDTGTGIPEDKTEKIFEKFHQASSDTSRLYGGTGLGLSIVKQLVESQGGNIRVNSKVGEGSVFSFTLNFKKTDTEAEEETEILEIAAGNKNIKVLVVEDIALNQLLMKTLLDEFGFERDIAANGKIAIEMLNEKNYDIVLMDLQMPEMNGFEATEYIRNNMHSKIPIIALTADVTTVDLEKCRAVGMNDYIAKPVDERILYSKIVGLVKKPAEITHKLSKANEPLTDKKTRCTDLAYLIGITKYDHKLMMEMIALYLDQTPVLITAIKKSLQDEDWESLHAAAHKMIPSFAIMGIDKDFETKVKKVQMYAGAKEDANEIEGLIQQIEKVCTTACKELEEEYNTLKNNIT